MPSWLGGSQIGRRATTQDRLGPPRGREGKSPRPPAWGERGDPISQPRQQDKLSGASRAGSHPQRGCRSLRTGLPVSGSDPPPWPPAPLAASPHLSTKARADGVWLLRQGKPSLYPAGLGRSHPDKEFDSSSPVVRQAGREGGNKQQAGRGPPGAWPCCGQAGQQGQPPAQSRSGQRGSACLAGLGDSGDRAGETKGLRLEDGDALESDPETETPEHSRPENHRC